MGDKFYAATKIKYGKRIEDGSQDGKYESTVFEVDDEVTGLPADEMKSLWNQGALRREKGDDKEKASSGDDKEKASSGDDKEKASSGDDKKAADDDAGKTPTKSTPAKVAPAKAANPS